MKKLLTTLALSIATLTMSVVAQAGPHDTRDYGHSQAQKFYAQKHYDDRKHYNTSSRYKKVNPSRDWRTGQLMPRQYHNSRYEVSHREVRRLPAIPRVQQWYKINGDYVLVNDRSGRIIRIING